MATIAEALAIARQALDAGNAAYAEQVYRAVLQADPDQADALLALGLMATAARQYDAAIAFFQRILQRMPDCVEAYVNLGIALRAQGRVEEAAEYCRRAYAIRPDIPEISNNLAALYIQLGRTTEAMGYLDETLRLRPGHAEAYYNKGTLFQRMEHYEEAEPFLRQAVESNPGMTLAWETLGVNLAEQGWFEEATAALERAWRPRGDPVARYTWATILPVIYRGPDEVTAARLRLESAVDDMLSDGCQIDPLASPVAMSFYLPYQGRSDRPILEKTARLFAQSARDFTAGRRAGQSERIRVGFVSSFWRNHTIARLWKGWIEHLDRRQFDVVVLALFAADDELGRAIRHMAPRYVELSPHLRTAQQQIIAEQLDILFYIDIGMDKNTYSLATSRLAPVQCVTWGHPTTTGLPTLDYYVSSRHLESAEADAQYTEKLVRLETFGLYLDRPAPRTAAKTRADFGLPQERHLYGCLQSLFKLQPDDDRLLGEILRRDPQGVILLPHGMRPHWTDLLRQRFERSIPDVVERIVWLPRIGYEDFLDLQTHCDVLLDPLHFGGGRTSIEALGLGLPIVTLPSSLLRGRMTNALYQTLGVTDLIARGPDEYVELALRVAADQDFRRSIQERILAGHPRLYEDLGAVREVERFLLAAASGQVAGRWGIS